MEDLIALSFLCSQVTAQLNLNFITPPSPSRTLFDLIVKLKKLQLIHGLQVNLIHVSGT